jgi:hypothetical protein
VAQQIGCIGSQAHTEIDGLVYFMSDDGLYATDGTAVEEVPGNDRIQQWFKTRLDSQMQRELTDGHEVTLFRHEGFVGIAIPDASNVSLPYVTLFYDPETESFWKTDLPVLDWQGYRDDGVQKAVFCRAPTSTSDTATDLVYQYAKSNAGDADDSGAAAYAAVNIAWYLRTAWLPFGTHREQRRIRRIWAVVKGAMTYTVTQYRDWASSSVASTARVVAGSDTVHIEGVVQADSHAVSLRLSSDRAPASVYGYAVDTQRRRKRYHA